LQLASGARFGKHGRMVTLLALALLLGSPEPEGLPPGFEKLPEMVALTRQATLYLAPASTSLRLPGANGLRVAMLSVNLGQAWLGVSNDRGDFDAARTQALQAALKAADPDGACSQGFAFLDPAADGVVYGRKETALCLIAWSPSRSAIEVRRGPLEFKRGNSNEEADAKALSQTLKASAAKSFLASQIKISGQSLALEGSPLQIVLGTAGSSGRVFAWDTQKHAIDAGQTRRIEQAVAKSCPGKHTVDGFDDGEGDELVVLLSAPADNHDVCVVRIVWDVAKANIVTQARRRFEE